MKSRHERLAEVPRPRLRWTYLAVLALVLTAGSAWMFVSSTREGNGGAQGFAIIVFVVGVCLTVLAIGSRSLMARKRR